MLVFRRLVLLTGLLAWILATSAAPVHEVLVQHARCDVHGETLDVGYGTAHPWTAAAQIGADEATGHGHACALEGVVLGVPVLDQPLREVTFEAVPRGASLPGGTAVVPGEPLAYAPKTSPPVPGSSLA